MRTIRTRRARNRFIRKLRERANVREACEAANISRTAAYDWRRDDEDFRAEWDRTVDEAVDRLEAIAWHRATHGVEKPIVYKGEVTGVVREPSDRLIELMLRAHRPEKYRERHEHTGPGGGPLDMSFNLTLVAPDGSKSKLAATPSSNKQIEGENMKDVTPRVEAPAETATKGRG